MTLVIESVAHESSVSANTFNLTTFGSACSAGESIYVSAIFASTLTITSITDANLNVYTQVARFTDTNGDAIEFWKSENVPASGAALTLTVNLSGSSAFFSGNATRTAVGSSIDIGGTNWLTTSGITSGPAANNITGIPSLTPSVNGCELLVMLFNGSNATAITAGTSPLTMVSRASTTTSSISLVESFAQVTAAAASPTASLAVTASLWDAIYVVINPASSVAPTTLWLSTELSPLAGAGQLALRPQRGNLFTPATCVTTTTASGTNIVVTKTAGGQVLSWWYQVGADVTIAGNITATIWGFESVATANAGLGLLLEWYDPTGVTLKGTILSDRTVPSTITEFAVSSPGSTKVLAAVAPTSSAMKAGDWIKLTLKIRNVGTMAAGTATINIGEASAGSQGESFISFTETLTPAQPAGQPRLGKSSQTYLFSTPHLTVPVPGDTASGRCVIMHLYGYWITATQTTSAAITPPDASWQLGYGISLHDTVDGVWTWDAWYYKYCTSVDIGTYSWTYNTVGGTAAGDGAGAAAVLYGMHQGNPFVDTIQSNIGSGSTATIATFTPKGPNSLLLLGANCFTPGTFTLPSDQWGPDSGNQGSNSEHALGVMYQGAAAATGSLVVTNSAPDIVSATVATIRQQRPLIVVQQAALDRASLY